MVMSEERLENFSKQAGLYNWENCQEGMRGFSRHTLVYSCNPTSSKSGTVCCNQWKRTTSRHNDRWIAATCLRRLGRLEYTAKLVFPQ